MSEKKSELALFGIALVFHLIVFALLISHHGPYSFFLSADGTLNNNDTQNYVTIAQNLTEGHGYSRFFDPPFEPDGFRTPLMALYFLPFIAVGGLQLIWLAILVLNVVVSCAPVILYKLARLCLEWRYAFSVGVALALEPLFVYRSQIAEPDGIMVLLLLSAMLFLVRGWKTYQANDYYIASALLGVAILAKPTALYLAAIVYIFHAFFLILFGRGTPRQRLINWGTGVCLACAIVSPWLVRNHVTFDTWSLSSVTGYNLYAYYTNTITLPDEEIPIAISQASRDAARDLRFQHFFTNVAFNRIRHQPFAYAREHVTGMARNLFVSDIAAIYYYGHADILPFAYDPESNSLVSWWARVSSGKLVWAFMLTLLYAGSLVGWAMSWKYDRLMFLIFTMFLAVFGYLIVASGPFVDAKYRLPGLPLLFVCGGYALAKSEKWLQQTLRFRVN